MVGEFCLDSRHVLYLWPCSSTHQILLVRCYDADKQQCIYSVLLLYTCMFMLKPVDIIFQFHYLPFTSKETCDILQISSVTSVVTNTSEHAYKLLHVVWNQYMHVQEYILYEPLILYIVILFSIMGHSSCCHSHNIMCADCEIMFKHFILCNFSKGKLNIFLFML